MDDQISIFLSLALLINLLDSLPNGANSSKIQNKLFPFMNFASWNKRSLFHCT